MCVTSHVKEVTYQSRAPGLPSGCLRVKNRQAAYSLLQHMQSSTSTPLLEALAPTHIAVLHPLPMVSSASLLEFPICLQCGHSFAASQPATLAPALIQKPLSRLFGGIYIGGGGGHALAFRAQGARSHQSGETCSTLAWESPPNCTAWSCPCWSQPRQAAPPRRPSTIRCPSCGALGRLHCPPLATALEAATCRQMAN